MATEDAQLRGGAAFKSIDQVWREKARQQAAGHRDAAGLASIFVLDVPEFEPLVNASRGVPGCRVDGPVDGYWHVSSAEPIVFERKPLGLVPALWNAALTGGFDGDVKVFDRNRLEIAPRAAS